jgi:hypothetical protein
MEPWQDRYDTDDDDLLDSQQEHRITADGEIPCLNCGKHWDIFTRDGMRIRLDNSNTCSNCNLGGSLLSE